jgi:equilibrative nucleoside transporter 1/2/3
MGPYEQREPKTADSLPCLQDRDVIFFFAKRIFVEPELDTAKSSTKMSSKGTYEKLEGAGGSLSRSLPIDAGSFAYAIMFYQGIGQLFPWNAFITASNYFGERFCTTPFAFDFENYLSISFTASQTIGLAMTILYGARLSYHDKIVYPLVIYSMLFGLTTALVLFANINGNILFWVTTMCCIGCGLSGAFLNAGFFGLSGIFPQSYTGAMMSGQGLAGLSVALTGLITQAAGPVPDGYCSTGDDAPPCQEYAVNYSAFSYFLIATIVLVSCIALFFVLMKLPFTILLLRGHGQGQVKPHPPTADDNMEEPLISVDNADMGSAGDDSQSVQSSSSSYVSSAGLSGIMKRNQGGNAADDDGLGGETMNPVGAVRNFKDSSLVNSEKNFDRDSNQNGSAAPGNTMSNIIGVFKIVKIPALTVFGVFAITLSIFPALVVGFTSVDNCAVDAARWRNDLFVPIFFVLFSLGDFCGRILAGGTRPVLSALNIHWAGLARLIFYPLFLLCNVEGSRLPIVFTNDAWPILFMCAFALSNGYVCSCCMMMGPTLVDTRDAPLAGNIMIFCLTAGLMAGSGLSFVVTFISQGHF